MARTRPPRRPVARIVVAVGRSQQTAYQPVGQKHRLQKQRKVQTVMGYYLFSLF